MHRWLLAFFTLCSLALAQNTHTVRPGETLYRIAKQYGTTVEALQQLNRIRDPRQLRVGQVLRLNGQPERTLLPSLPAPFTSIELPLRLAQGQAFRVRVNAGDLPVQVRFLGITHPVREGSLLLAVPRLHPPGAYRIDFQANGVVHTASLRVVAVERGRQSLVLPPDRRRLLAADLLIAERNQVLRVCAAGPQEQLWRAAWRRPVERERITAIFGVLRSFNGGPFRSYHEGLDYGLPTGTPVYAPAPGVVGLAESLAVRGNAVVLQHGLGVCSGYWHLSRITVRPGQRVNAGDLIGHVGSTGLSTGPHLHYEIRVHGVPTDPMPWYFRTP
ncbi:M23 family metallopeptidase [uncultured Meiothermus sp.]|jgi:murein DD-endopeptidase MepM/ murein hydrolase activator NlpD|uniref:LysM peptidoglycan-binding domain-containing M23 family metallopeptidase n=1 Tax=uncultured Meiothermus sp. TaxID=157471 RepID=UPI00260376E1|nr:M23 family metallopeptidase [uncultured Meiothermus sp.]